MLEETVAYIEYLETFKEVNKPQMPNFSISAYTDNEYINAINQLNMEYELIDDFQLTLKHLKEE